MQAGFNKHPEGFCLSILAADVTKINVTSTSQGGKHESGGEDFICFMHEVQAKHDKPGFIWHDESHMSGAFMKHLGEELSVCNPVSTLLSHYNQRKNDPSFMQIPQKLAILNNFKKKRMFSLNILSLPP